MSAQPHVYRHLFCVLCESVAVLRCGDMCIRCIAAMEADLYPNTRGPLPLEPPRFRRLRRWVTRTERAGEKK